MNDFLLKMLIGIVAIGLILGIIYAMNNIEMVLNILYVFAGLLSAYALGDMILDELR